MNKDELSELQSLKVHPGYIRLTYLFKQEFDKQYMKLRKVKSCKDSEYGKITGFLDGLEFAMNHLDNIIDEGIEENKDQNPES